MSEQSVFFDPKKHDKGFKKGPKRYFPSWRYGPGYTGPLKDGREDPQFARIFNKAEEVPEGWVKSPEEAKALASAAPAVVEPTAPQIPAPNRQPLMNKKQREAAEKAAKARVDLIAELVAAKFDPAELATATDAELAAAKAGLTNGSDH